MGKTCGTCGHCRITHDGPYCIKGSRPHPVSAIRTMDCWVDPGDMEKEPVLTKVCSKCGRELPIENFGRHSRTKDGYQPCCRECQSAMNKGHKKRQPDQHNEAPAKAPELTAEQMGIGRGRRAPHPSYVDKDTGITMKWCNGCNQYKPIDDFHRNRANKDGHEFSCKACHNAKVTEQKRRRSAAKKALKEEEKRMAEEYMKLQQKGAVPVMDPEPAPIEEKEVLTPEEYKAADLQAIVEALRGLGISGQLVINI